MKTYNVYAILDPRYYGPFKYGKFYFESMPIYIGKGSRIQRKFDHFRNCDINSNTNKKKSNLIRKLIKLGYSKNELTCTIADNLNEFEALSLEKVIIKTIGRINGPLTNLTDGGDGVSGRIISDQHKNILKRRMIGTNNPNFGKTGNDNPFYNKKHTEETKKIMSIAKIGKKHPNRKRYFKYDWFVGSQLIDLKIFCIDNNLDYLDIYSRFRNNKNQIIYKKKWIFSRKLK